MAGAVVTCKIPLQDLLERRGKVVHRRGAVAAVVMPTIQVRWVPSGRGGFVVLQSGLGYVPSHIPSMMVSLPTSLLAFVTLVQSFTDPKTFLTTHRRADQAQFVLMARGSSLVGRRDESRRQARFAQLVRSELAAIIRDGSRAVKTSDRVSSEVLQTTSVFDVQISPDLRSATATITTRGSTAAKREAYTWLVRNAKSVRYALAQRLSHTKRAPEIHFRKADVSAATQLMALIDNVNRNDGQEQPSGMIDGLNFDLDEVLADDFDDEDGNLDDDDEDILDQEDSMLRGLA